jgi:hypothetical protein
VVKRGNGYSYVLSLGRDDADRTRQRWVSGFLLFNGEDDEDAATGSDG